jgi:hypothetical protein
MDVLSQRTEAHHVSTQVKEYVLIGEADGGICGHPQLTWGIPAHESDTDSDGSQSIDGADALQAAERCDLRAAQQSRCGASAYHDGANLNVSSSLETCHFAFSDSLISAVNNDFQQSSMCIGRDEWQACPFRKCPFHGFVRVDLPYLSKWQLCCTDERWLSNTVSTTVSFRRVQ